MWFRTQEKRKVKLQEELGWIKVGKVNKMSNHGVTTRRQCEQH